MKILLAVDGSEHTKRMLAWMAAHEEWLGPEHQYVVLTVVPPIPPHAMEFLDADYLRSYDNEQAEAVFKPIRAFIDQHKLQATYVHEVGHAGDAIAEVAAEQKVDMLVMGSHGRGALAGLVMGSVATRVVAVCKTPVLLIR
ncbi:MAG: universal stress protein [Aquabacterium sp.]|jgi:nucleotide-binding universal stress UspA family protein|nr:MAG: universal stress protein [Aquabacterium sp.]